MPQNLQPMLDKLSMWSDFDEADATAILALPFVIRRLRANELLVREDDRPRHSSVLLSGFAIRHKLAGNGGRQIFSIHVANDIIDLHNSILERADHNLQALTDIEVASIPVEDIRALVANRPAVGRAMWYETLVDAAIFREWTLNVGRRDARARTAHMLCEFGVRLQVAGLGETDNYELPMTQDQLGDALALTSVHINRTLQALAAEGLIERTRRSVRIADFARLAAVGDFDSRYLHIGDKRLNTYRG